MPTDPAPVFDTMTSLGVQSATLAALVWFGRRFIALHENLLQRIDAVLAESRATREAMERARESFVTVTPADPPSAPPKTRTGRRVGALLIAAMLPFLAGCTSVSETWLAADRATHDAVAPEYLRYVEGDDGLTEDAKEARRMVIETWRIRLVAAAGE